MVPAAVVATQSKLRGGVAVNSPVVILLVIIVVILLIMVLT